MLVNQTNATAKVGIFSVQKYEKQQQNDSQKTAVNGILDDAQVGRYALTSLRNQTLLYGLFAAFATFELGAALFFYIGTFTGLEIATATAVVLSIAFAVLSHTSLTSATIGIVFGLYKHSKAAKQAVALNTVIAVLLCVTSSLIVFFIGKPSFESYRLAQYHTPPTPKIDATMLQNSSGKLSVSRTNAAVKLAGAAEKTNESDRTAYDHTTAKISDIVGISAFFIEFILLVLAYGIASAKRAATIEITAANDTESAQQDQAQHAQKFDDYKPYSLQKAAQNTAQPQAQPQAQRRQAGFVQGYQKNSPTQCVTQCVKNTNNSEITVMKQPNNSHITATTPPEIVTPENDNNSRKTVVKQPENRCITGVHTPESNEAVTVEEQLKNSQITARKQSVTGNKQGKDIVPTTGEKQAKNTAFCAYCNTEFKQKTTWHTYCAESCKIAAYELRTGKKFYIKK